MIKKHYLRHSLIPEDGIYKEYTQIRNESFSEIFNYCLERKFTDTINYLYHEWYNLSACNIWLRSVQSEFVCRYRTSMFAESHYRILKRDYFSIFGRPVRRLRLIIELK